MSKHLPWDDIPVPTGEINRRLAAAGMRAPASWAVDHQGRRLFVLELAGDHWSRYQQSAVKVHGLDIDLRSSSSDNQLLVLTLESEQNIDLFHVLCNSLLAELVEARSPASALETALNHLRRWKAFLSSKQARVLSLEEIRGLFAEVWFLLELLGTPAGARGAVGAWHGPERAQQDFIFSDLAVEVKSLVATDPRTVRVSSENQLDSLQKLLYLLIVFVKESRDDSGQSLNQIVAEAQSLIAGTDVAFEFESKLAEFGYIPLREYDHPLLEVVGNQPFRVEDGFPRIIRSQVPNGVIRVKYQIELEHLEPFRCDYQLVLGSVP
ncbi:MAG: PD-(D/E)XK motif protein [Fimbriimonadaceae bacterium]|nr:PD-(D/E)XK motif protein [Fimbriimonadaceae bacterium]